MSRMPVLFISHGGGPWPYIEEMRKNFAVSEKALRELPMMLPSKPKAIISVSGHWEEDSFTVATSAHPPMVYDYSGFPEHTYRIQYSAPGVPELAKRVRELLTEEGLGVAESPTQGFDHGTFVPLYLMYPQAEIPVLSLSIRSDYDAGEHIRMGRALQSLRDESVLIIGSGLTYHNLRRFGPDGAQASEVFADWLTESLSRPDRADRLIHWEQAPFARAAHPREDHLVPLMVSLGAAGDDLAKVAFIDRVWEIKMVSYRFG